LFCFVFHRSGGQERAIGLARVGARCCFHCEKWLFCLPQQCVLHRHCLREPKFCCWMSRQTTSTPIDSRFAVAVASLSFVVCARCLDTTLLGLCTQAVKESLIENRPKGQTILCITHDLSTIQDADLILFFEKDPNTGITTISAQGTYQSLLEDNDAFRQWHAYKWGNHNTNVQLSLDTAAAAEITNDDESPPTMTTTAVGTNADVRYEFLRQELARLHSQQVMPVQTLRSRDDFQRYIGSVRCGTVDMRNAVAL